MTRVKNKKAQGLLRPYLSELPERNAVLVRKIMKQIVARKRRIAELEREVGELVGELVGREIDFERSGWLQEGVILERHDGGSGRVRILNLDTGTLDWLDFDVVWPCYDPDYPYRPRRRKAFENKA